MGKAYDILGIGRCAVDDLLFVETYPPADAKVRVRRRERQAGGLTGTALVAAARLGGMCAYAGTMGAADVESEFLLAALAGEGVDVEHAGRLEGARPNRSEIIVDETNRTRTIFSDPYVGEGLPVRDELVAAARVLYVDHSDAVTSLHPVRVAGEQGVAVVADIEKEGDPGVTELMARVGHLAVTVKFARRVTGVADPEAAARALWNERRAAVVLTDGARGSWGFDGTTMTHQPAFPVEVVDTTGCGDVFHGVYALGVARGMTMAERLRWASGAAAIKATRVGGQRGCPDGRELEEFLKGR